MPPEQTTSKAQSDQLIEKVKSAHENETACGLSAMYLRVFMDAADPIVIEDLSGVVIDLNVEAERAYDWNREELIGQPIKRLVPDARHGQADDMLRRCLAGESVRNLEGKRCTRGGEVIDVLLTLSLLKDERGEPAGIASLAKDITALRTTMAEHEALVRAMNRVQAVIHFGLDGTVVDANENFLQIFGYTLDEVVGKHHRIFCDASYAESPEYVDFWKKLVRGEFEAGEFNRRHKDGREIWLQASYNPVFDKDGKLIKVVKFASDITQEVEARSLAMMEMATPVTRIWDGVLFAPIVGIVDSRRAHDIMNKTLSSIVDQGAHVLLLDISGVGMVDTAVANHLIKIAKAAVLMGCRTIISGISPAIAQTITELGVELGEIRTTSTIESALREAISRDVGP